MSEANAGLRASGIRTASGQLQSGPRCWVCGADTRPFWTQPAFDAVACVACGHVQAQHHAASAGTDYHRAYEQGEFVESLAATRRRQSQRLLDALSFSSEPPRSLFDFGCGRGWLLEAARERGMQQLAGGDVSALALELLASRGIAGVQLDELEPFERLDFARLGFVPEVISLLDVVEHFAGDLQRRLAPWIERLPSGVRYLVVKVPVQDGLLFSLANGARRLGVNSLGNQLFQVGTFPPHQQYFTRRSLGLFGSGLGLETLLELDDIDFEPAGLGGRLSASLPLVRRLGGVAGHVLALAATQLRRADSRTLILRRRARRG